MTGREAVLLGFQTVEGAVFRSLAYQISAVLEAFVEGLQVQLLECLRDGIGHRFAQVFGIQYAGDRRKEADHDHVENHLLPQFLGQPRGRDTVDTGAALKAADPHHVLLDDEQAALFQLRAEAREGFLRHYYQDVRLGDVRVGHRLVRQNDLRAGRSTAGFRAEALRHGGEVVLENARGFPDDGRRENHSLAAKAGDPDLG